jgi:hypothetical protein
MAADEGDLYASRKKIQPRSIKGRFNSLRWAMVWITQVVFYGLAWLPWNGRQAVLFDLLERKFYIFGLVLWPQDVVYLTLLLIISALGLFLVTAVAGRVWCGYACPQSVYTEIFMWIERHIEGDRSARMKLDAAPMSARKLGLRAAKHGIWALLAMWTGFTFVGYFTPIKELAAEIASWKSVRGKASGWSSTRLSPICLPVTCASRCASTCVRTRAFRASCSIRTRSSSATTPIAASRAATRRRRRKGNRSVIVSTATGVCRYVRPASTSARVCSTNASAARCASMPAIR